MLDHQPPQRLLVLHARLSRRCGAPGVRLLDLPGRWLVFRTVDLERAVVDVEPSQHHTVEGLAEMESRAPFAVGENHDATLALMSLTRRLQPRHDFHAAPATPVLAITAWNLAHLVAVRGHIDLDEAGTPVVVNELRALPRTESRRPH